MKTLKDIEKKNNFKVPEDYFDNMEKEVIKKIKSGELIKKPSPFQVFKPYLYMAASVILLAYGIKTVLNISVNKKSETIISKIEDFSYTFDDMISELSYDELAFYEYLNDEDNNYWASEELINDDEDLIYLEDYLAQYYLEYELE
ncbi:MAG: hypothetical protein GX793_05265 [Bacteroidales bacterium]|jgi:hypothetical protein|nr:hypothetical protein [Bacteroidales bacterium]MCK9499703.1 hypothetical protein [Bacteroidales bacterium]MDY0314642.1 hypothetical protein [Bacteroidales bacterium]NLB86452.1 hypothetical protein [Bacteroidales bacterium]